MCCLFGFVDYGHKLSRKQRHQLLTVLSTCCEERGTQSSQLRMLIVPIRQGDVDGRQLKAFQDNPELLTTHMFYFLQWVGEHGDEIISGIVFLLSARKYLSKVNR